MGRRRMGNPPGPVALVRRSGGGGQRPVRHRSRRGDTKRDELGTRLRLVGPGRGHPGSSPGGRGLGGPGDLSARRNLGGLLRAETGGVGLRGLRGDRDEARPKGPQDPRDDPLGEHRRPRHVGGQRVPRGDRPLRRDRLHRPRRLHHPGRQRPRGLLRFHRLGRRPLQRIGQPSGESLHLPPQRRLQGRGDRQRRIGSQSRHHGLHLPGQRREKRRRDGQFRIERPAGVRLHLHAEQGGQRRRRLWGGRQR